MKTVSLGLVSVLSTGLGLFLLSTIQVSAQPLVMNTPTGSMTDGANISINPEEPLPTNGTVSISTEGVADTDMNVIPPVGVTVVIENDTVTITNQAVDIETAEDDTGDGGSGDGGSGDGGSGDGGQRRWWQRRWWQRRWWQRRGRFTRRRRIKSRIFSLFPYIF